MKHYIYLCGPITSLSYKGATDWREEVAALLNSDTVQCLSPMRGKSYLSAATSLKAEGYDNPMSTNRGIMRRDHFDCTRASVLFVNLLGATKPSLGTAMEVAWAYDRHIPVVLVMEDEMCGGMPAPAPRNPHRHAMILEAAAYVVPTLEEAVRLTKVLLEATE